MFVVSRLLSHVIKLLVLHVMIFVVSRDLTRLQTARLGILPMMEARLAAPGVSLVEHDLTQLSHVKDTAADGLPEK